ncbi:MAG: hypothetical protein ACLU38_07350 [Dysosmobacter sp.]
MEVFTAALLEAVKQGKEFLIRSAAGLVRVLGNVDHRSSAEAGRTAGHRHRRGRTCGGRLSCEKTTEQLECLLNAGLELCPICFDAESATSGGLEKERDRVLMEAERAIRERENGGSLHQPPGPADAGERRTGQSESQRTDIGVP